ncbi:MAG: hypothetical protein C4555_06025 [Dehalococcoidia bacterium]|jgi:ssDNA-binding Zn-finger/Zn-ribbon topoisomerase 1|nr:MAG: hypothetical protein C4555_06025 [Dehalococcoidia bacterium]
MAIRLKSCPKCGGDVRIDRDEYGWFEQCIQCGYERDLETIVVKPQHPQRGEPQKGGNWHHGNVELGPIVPFSLPSEDLRKEKRARTA